jgi:NAD(P)H dehydrogenase (quinone)
MTARRVAVVGGNGKTGVAVSEALRGRGAEPVPLGRGEWDDLATAMEDCEAAYLIAPNFHPDEPGYVGHALEAARAAGVGRVGYHSVASPYVPAMAHHLAKAAAEDVVRRAGLRWTILQPGVYVENFDVTSTVHLPYRADAEFGFLRLADLGAAVAEVLLGSGHEGATYELASLQGTVADLARDAGVDVVVESVDPQTPEGLSAMFAYYDAYGLPAGVLPLQALLAGRGAA